MRAIIRIGIADDQMLVRDGLERIISAFGGPFKVTLQAADGRALLAQLSEQHAEERPDVCLIDINMPVMDGYETVEAVRRLYPGIHLLALSVYDNEFVAIRLLRSGVKGYLKKDSSAGMLRMALLRVSEGQYYHPYIQAERLQRKYSHAEEQQLSDRQLCFLRYCCSELTYQQIAEQMDVSVRTIHGYRDSLFEKLGVKTRTGLAIYAITEGLSLGHIE